MQQEIIVICDNDDATIDISFKKPLGSTNDYRLTIFPINTLLKYHPSEKLITEAVDYIVEKKENILSVIFCRCSSAEAMNILEFANEKHMNTICFLDDDLTEVPLQLGRSVYDHYNNADRKKNIESIIKSTKKVVTSTEKLKETLQKKYPNLSIDHLHRYRSAAKNDLREHTASPANDKRVIIGYMGSQSHAHDLAPLLDALAHILSSKNNVYLEFFGTIEVPWELKKFSEKIIQHGKCHSYDSFMRKLTNLNWTYGLAPLNDLNFNHNKANTKWVEYTCANIATIASDVIPYDDLIKREVCINGSRDWRKALEDAVENHQQANEFLIKAKALISTDYQLEDHLSDLIEKIVKTP